MTASTKEKHDSTSQEKNTSDFYGAAIINSEGQEVPITEEMVKQACEKLEESRKKPE